MDFRHLHKSYWHSWMTTALLAAAALGGFILYTNLSILEYRAQIYSPDTVPAAEHVIVFGGGMDADGVQSFMQQDRVTMGVSLMLSEKGEMLTISGDDGYNRFDEVSSMYDQAIAAGLTETQVQMDPHGYRTYESCWRARHILGMSSAIVVSHEFHLSRIIYLCEQHGLRVVGVAADAREYYDDGWVSGPREILARVKAWWQAEVTRPTARIAY